MDTSSILNHIDWSQYETTVFDGVRDAFVKYTATYADSVSEKVYAVGIWTDAQVPITGVNFETVLNAKREFLFRAGVRDEQELIKAIEEWEPFDYPTMLRTYKYYEYHSIQNPELMGLMNIDFADHESDVAAFAHIEQALLQVVERIRKEHLLFILHSEDEVWICVNSPRDWHDHGILVRRNDSSIVRTVAGQLAN